MTNKTEDKFYFGKPDQPERFANLEGNYQKIEARYSFPDGTTDMELMSGSALSAVRSAIKKITARGNGAKAWVIAFVPANPRTNFPAHQKDLWKGEVIDGRAYERGGSFSRPGQPERFAAQIVSKRGTKRTEIKRDATGKWAAVLIQSNQTGVPGEPSDEQVLDMKWYATEANARTAAAKMLSARPGQPERFAISSSDLNYAKSQIRAATPQRLREIEQELLPLAKSGDKNAKILLDYLKSEWNERYRGTHSRPGQPERFGDDKDMMGTNKRIIRARGHEFLAEDEGNRTRISIKIDGVWEHATTVNTDNQTATEWIEANAKPGHPSRWLPYAFSRPGQPDKFDASSLERGSFAEASKSPMLGKLISEKAMPEGGWRAVQVGSDTLVISFEDADLARDFGRRAASKGYSATSPVATTGRYWNVEVKNG